VRLHEKTLATTALLTGIVVLALYGSTQAIVTNSAIHTEEEHVRQHVDRVFKVLLNQLTNLDAVAGDWAAWDDTYRFVADANQEYVESNLVDQTFINLRINLLLIVDSSGSIVFGKAFDLSDMTEEPMPSGLDRMLSPTGKLVHHESAESKTVGIVILDGMPMFVASRPILTSDAQGPIRGAFIMGVFLDSTEMSRLSELLDEVVAVRAITDAEMPADFQDALTSLSDSTTVTVRPLSEERVAGYGLLDDIYDEPALILRIDEPRDFYRESQTIMSYLGLSLLVVCAIFGVATLYSLERLVLSPLASLGTDVNRVRLSGFISPHMSTTGGEEFGDLVDSINMTLDALRMSETKYRALFENAPQGIYQTSAEGKLLTANPALVHLLGYGSQTELLSVDVENDLYVRPEERRKWVKELEIRGKMRDAELVLKRKDGTELTVLDNAHLVYDDQGELLYHEGTLTDITERKRMEKELALYSEHLQELVDERTKRLAESERRFRELADLLPQIVFETDYKGKLTFANRAGLAAAGYTQEDLDRGLNALQLFASEDRSTVQDRIGRILAGERSKGAEYSLLRKDGSAFPVIVHIAPVILGSRAVGLRGIAIDISDRKMMEAQVVKSERLAAIGETVMMVGHDLRNPLQVMMNSLALWGHIHDSMPPDCRDYADKHGFNEVLDRVERQLNYMNKIVSDLQDYARPVKPELTALSLPEFMRETLSTVSIPKNINVSVESSEDLVIKLDSALMRRVFTNLMTNAIQAMPNGGSLAVVISKKEGSAIIDITDTGVGIHEENLPKIFQPLFTTKSKGQGLGLPVCKRFVEAHGGGITLKSKVGVGTTFTVSLPLR